MTIDLWMLVLSAVLCAALPVVGISGLARIPGGLTWGFSNRDSAIALPLWIERARRAHMNMVENLPVFAVLVLVAHVAGRADSMTALGAQIFFVARVAHAAIYIVGVPVLRTVAFGFGVVGEVLILLRILA